MNRVEEVHRKRREVAGDIVEAEEGEEEGEEPEPGRKTGSALEEGSMLPCRPCTPRFSASSEIPSFVNGMEP